METKKDPRYDLEKQRPVFFGIGMIVSLSLTLVGFEWKSQIDPVIDFKEIEIISCGLYLNLEEEITYEPPSTSWKSDGSVYTNDERYDAGPLLADSISITCASPAFLDNKSDQLFLTIAESMPEFPGGQEALLKAINEKIEYPEQAERLGVEGRVFVRFIVEKDGSLSDFKVLKGIGAGCDEEAIRVMKLLPDFIPAEQRGVDVRVQMIMPVKFQLE